MSKEKLYEALSRGTPKQVEDILEENPELLEAVVTGKSLLNIAASKNNVPVMAFLVDRGISINLDLVDVEPAIVSAADNGCLEAVQWLLMNGADPNGSKHHLPPLVGAIHSGNVALVKVLLDAGADSDFIWGELSYSPITFANSFGASHDAIKLLLREQACDFQGSSNKSDSTEKSELESHLEQYYGSVRSLSIKLVSGFSLSIYVVDHAGKEPCKILVTSGMSEFSMPVPVGAEGYRYAELMMFLPTDWPLETLTESDTVDSWPVEWLFRLANFPRENNVWLGKSSVFSNGEPSEPVSENASFSAFFVLPNPDNSGSFMLSSGKRVQLYSVYPIYSSEKEYEEEYGPAALLKEFERSEVSAIINPSRREVLKIS